MSWAWVMVAMLGLLLGARPAQATVFSVNYSPTGIAFDAVSNRVSLANGSGVTTYTTNGTQVGVFGTSSGNFDLGAGTGGNVWVANGNNGDKDTFTGSFITGATLPSGTVALGRELSVGGTNYLLYAVNGGNVVALNLSNNTQTVLLPTPANITGGDWILRPGGASLNDVYVALNTISTAKIYDSSGNLFQSISFDSGYGQGKDVSFGVNELWAAQANFSDGNAVTYPFTVPPAAVKINRVSATNSPAGVALTLTCPNAGVAWSVLCATNPAGPWQTLPATWTTNTTELSVTLTNAAPAAFYRLQWP